LKRLTKTAKSKQNSKRSWVIFTQDLFLPKINTISIYLGRFFMKEKTRTVLFWFILIQPFLDLYWFYHGKLADVLPFTLPTIIRILAVFVIFCMFFSQKQNWQKLGQDKWLILYLALLILYSIIHLIDRKSTRLNSSHVSISYAVFCLKKKR